MDIKQCIALFMPARELRCLSAERSTHTPDRSCPNRGREKGIPGEPVVVCTVEESVSKVEVRLS
jgi:hypothetical protein